MIKKLIISLYLVTLFSVNINRAEANHRLSKKYALGFVVNAIALAYSSIAAGFIIPLSPLGIEYVQNPAGIFPESEHFGCYVWDQDYQKKRLARQTAGRTMALVTCLFAWNTQFCWNRIWTQKLNEDAEKNT